MLALFPILLFAFGSSDSIHLKGSAFDFELSPSAPAPVFWTNSLTHSRLSLSGGSEFEIETGDDPKHPHRVDFEPGFLMDFGHGHTSTFYFFSKDRKLGVALTYSFNYQDSILHKSLFVTNGGKTPIRILNVVLGRFPVGNAKVEGGQRGFPLYLNQQFFVSLKHPAGFSHVEGKDVVLRQYPGVKLEPNSQFQSMEAIYGVAAKGEARATFVSYVKSQMARVIYHQDKPYSILESFGGQQAGDFRNNFSIGDSEDYLLQHLGDVAESRKQNAVNFDFYSIEFWHDTAGDLTTFNRKNFPNGFDQVRDKILDTGMKPGLWIDSGGLPEWTVGDNPSMQECKTNPDGTGNFCRAGKPLADLYKRAYLYQMATNHVGLVKFDNLGRNGASPVCNNPKHDHLPGPLYSTEAIYNSVIDFFSTLRDANPNIFMMLYWGYNSPWWLQWGDTYFECGAPIEGASPAQYPTPYARDAVTQRLDQAQLTIEDTPWLGKDSLGVWLSNWSWNSNIGKSRWQEGTIMDMARGSLLFQLWTDERFLTPPERDQEATFMGLMKANPNCFENSRPILGNANKQEPYGYSCSDGKRAFLCIDNACLNDSLIKLSIGSKLGLPDGQKWDVYRWYPEPAQMRDTALKMRPYEVALLEVVPRGESPSLGRRFELDSSPNSFTEPSVALKATAIPIRDPGGLTTAWSRLQPQFTKAAVAKLAIRKDGSVLAGGPNPRSDTYTVIAHSGAKRITGILLEALPDDSLPSHGPGRAYNGNFALSKLQIMYSTGQNRDMNEAKFRSATADFEQTSFGGMPAKGIIDEDPATRWSIHPRVGMPHSVVLELKTPIESTSGVDMTFTLEHGDPEHNLGRFRLSTTDSATPTFPEVYRTKGEKLFFTLPKTQTGGLLFFIGGDPDNVPVFLVDGHPIAVAPVWSKDANWGCPWTAWRIEIDPADVPRRAEISLKGDLGANWSLHFLPK